MSILTPIMRANWPSDKPEPTQAEYDQASARYAADLDPNDWSDWPLGLSFVMATYNRETWLKYFE
jgi:hypothetical protein